VTRSRLLLGVASVLAGTSVLLGVFGLVYNPVLLLAALPFAAATYLIWSHATGRLEARMRERAAPRRAGAGAGPAGGDGPADPSGPWSGDHNARAGPGRRGGAEPGAGRRPPGRPGGATPSRSAAAGVLGVAPDADEDAVRRAFREKARELHPDAPDGDEAEFRRVRAAYERLVNGR
jgi:DnaJ-domain-containing protein 1